MYSVWSLCFLPALPWAVEQAPACAFAMNTSIATHNNETLTLTALLLLLAHRVRAVLLAVKHAGQFKVVLLLNLGPIPKLVTHYLIAFPVDITFWPALLASVLGCLPGNVLAVLFGRNIKGLSGGCGPLAVGACQPVSCQLQVQP